MWFFVLQALGSSPEICDGIDNDIDALIDEGGVCGSQSLIDAATGHAYAVLPAGSGSNRAAACAAIGYHPADPTSDAEMSLLEVYGDGTEYWMGITRSNDQNLDSTGAPVAFSAWNQSPPADGGCSRIGELGAIPGTSLQWRWLSDLTCNAAIYPYLCEADCERIEVFADADQDGYGGGPALATCAPMQSGYLATDGDCDDTVAASHPGGSEICDGLDNDCDGDIDEDAIDAPLWYLDTDGDGAGDDSTGIASCTALSGRVSIGGDCAPEDPLIHPFAPEACTDGIDNDCDGLTDLDDPDFQNSGVVFWEDGDGDGVGNPSVEFTGCSGTQPIGFVSTNNGEDCDDGNNLRSPLLAEICDGIDNDCNGQPDNGLSFLDYWPDGDSDGFGDESANGTNACAPPGGMVGNQLDCDDEDDQINPFADEVCDEVDNDCNGQPDDGLPGHDYYPDLDLDGYGDMDATPVFGCAPLDDLVTDGSDCDDADPHIHPGAVEDPEDQIDSDCDGTIEEPPTPTLVDSDGDSIPDTIDPTPEGYELQPGPTPAGADYGFGCSTQGRGLPWLGVIRR